MNYNPPFNPMLPGVAPDWDEFSWSNPETFDPTLSYKRHPILPAGVNDWAINGLEVNAAGINEPIWAEPFQDAEFYPPSVVDQTDMTPFECPDIVVRPVDSHVAIRPHLSTVVIRGKPCRPS